MRSPPNPFPSCAMRRGGDALWQNHCSAPSYTYGHLSPYTVCSCVLLLIFSLSAPSCPPFNHTVNQANRNSGALTSFVIVRSSSTSSETMIESHRRRILGALNSRYIYGKVVSDRECLACSRHGSLIHCLSQPLLHTLVFLLQMAVVSIVTRRFNSYYAARPGTHSKWNKCRIDC